jgi:hypothetical protein
LTALQKFVSSLISKSLIREETIFNGFNSIRFLICKSIEIQTKRFFVVVVAESSVNVSQAMFDIGYTVTHCRFEATDPDSDEVNDNFNILIFCLMLVELVKLFFVTFQKNN